MKNYIELVSRKAPEGLWQWAASKGHLDTAGLIYHKEWAVDTSPEAMLTAPGRKRPIVKCRCSACGETVTMEYASAKSSDGATYGFIVPSSGGYELEQSGDGMLCPVCGCPVSIKCRSKVSGDVYAGCEAWITAEFQCMSASLLPGVPGHRPLVLTAWDLRKYCSKEGKTIPVCLPYEAYVFDGGSCAKLGGWVKGYGGHTGYFGMFRKEWVHPRKWGEDWGSENDIFGLTEALIQDSCMHNAKLMEYMTGGLRGNKKYPISYLRLYQEAPAVENLVVQGACFLLDGMLAEVCEKNLTYGLPVLEDLDLEQVRPSAMLGLNREEFRQMVEQTWHLQLYRLYRDCKESGEFLSDDAIQTAFLMGEAEDLRELVGRVPMGKAIRYLFKQQAAWEQRMLYDPEIDLYVDPGEFDRKYAEMFSDYLNSAVTAGWDITDPSILWPRDLEAAHDRAAEAARTRVKKESRQLFRERYKELSKYTARFDGILIRPCRSQKELTAEGEALKHCVAGYANSVATGKTAIFFIRRETEPDKPWYTLEFDEKELRIRQNRGYRNDMDRPGGADPEAIAFGNKWLAWIHAGAERDKDGMPILPHTDRRKSA